MSKSVIGSDYVVARRFIDEALEPHIKKLIEETNKTLAVKGIHLGAEINWFIDYIDGGTADENDKPKAGS